MWKQLHVVHVTCDMWKQLHVVHVTCLEYENASQDYNMWCTKQLASSAVDGMNLVPDKLGSICDELSLTCLGPPRNLAFLSCSCIDSLLCQFADAQLV